MWTLDDFIFTADGDNKVQVEHYSNILRKNFVEIFKIVGVDYQNVFSSLFMHYANNVFSRVSILDLFNAQDL